MAITAATVLFALAVVAFVIALVVVALRREGWQAAIAVGLGLDALAHLAG